ncbi:MAG: triose-phosphate isomerase [Planctomycetota bacterium]|nr:triose-phosphate isomerase [Planctomycetota bacterium]
MRRPFLAGNWKMNLDRRSALDLVNQVRAAADRRADVDVAVFPSYVYLDEVARALAGSRVRLGAQDMCHEDSGAFTGAVSAARLTPVGCESDSLGHPARRHGFGARAQLVGAKVRKALEAGIDPILCVGETIEEREDGRTEEVVKRQLVAGLASVSAAEMSKVTIAYEPVWAIGTGLTATSEQAGAVHDYLRGVLAGLFDEAVANATRIQYGGSVKPSNVSELMAVDSIDGALVGGASLDGDSFTAIIEFQN